MKAHPLYLEKFEYSPSLIFPKFSVLIISSLTLIFFYKGQFIRAKMMSTENFGKNKGQSVLNFLDVRARRWGKK